ncbi:MAG: SH3 domain-containing protein, partial [Chloroflexi bacterium]|nr:SH3 domain-containing protein [Chloroflexota bacterium]
IERGIIDAVDVWGWLGGGAQVCFRQSGGSLLFLDATTTPRVVSELPAYSVDGGMICAFIDRPGTVVLAPGPRLPTATPAPPPSQSLQNCMVTTAHILNFRAGPGGAVIQPLIPYNVTLTAVERTAGWFKVDYHGAKGWISAAFVKPQGACG